MEEPRPDAPPAASDAPLSELELERWRAFRRASDAVLDRVRREVRAATGLSAADFEVLAVLDAGGDEGVRQIHLCEAMGWSQSRTTNHLGRMETRGLVARRALDGVGLEVRATVEGRETLRRARPVHAAAVRRSLLAALDEDAHRAIAELAQAQG